MHGNFIKKFSRLNEILTQVLVFSRSPARRKELLSQWRIDNANSENNEFLFQIKDPKFRPKIDPSLPIVVQKVMKSCWRADEKKRPSMDQVARFLIHAPSNL